MQQTLCGPCEALVWTLMAPVWPQMPVLCRCCLSYMQIPFYEPWEVSIRGFFALLNLLIMQHVSQCFAFTSSSM